MKREKIIKILCTLISVVTGLITKDLIIGGISLLTGLLCAYYASIGKRINYILGLINYLIMGLVAFKNNLYGLFFFYIFIFSPSQVIGYLSWNKNLDEYDSVNVREFNIKNSIIITTSCILGSFLLGYILTKIPNQQLAYLDATSNCINLCGVILMILRFKEAWFIWLVNNIIDLIIWIIITINHGKNAPMMLLVSIGYLLINIYGIIKWNQEAKNNKIKENTYE